MRHVKFLVFWVLADCFASQVPTTEMIEDMAADIQDRLLEMVELNSGYDNLKTSYQHHGGIQEYQQMNRTAIVQEMAAKMSSIFSKKVKALENLKMESEEIVKKYKYEQQLRINDVDYLNMKSEIPMELNGRLKKETYMNRSGIQMPVDIFEGYPEVLNGIRWSDHLDPVFKKNYEDNPYLAWQFFGSNAGFIRVYPANRWRNVASQPDLYDVRSRPWYVQGATSPKDVLILMDTSGSVHGSTISTMKLAVRVILRMLGEDDYVNVAWFNNTAGWTTCFKTFVQANSLNKAILFNGVDNVSDGNMANYTNALKFSFQEFAKFERNKMAHEGAECHKVIMMFTDGGADKPDQVVNKYNKDKKVRIFTYAVGTHATRLHVVERLACENRGYFDSIVNMNAIRTHIQKFLSVLLRPMALSNISSVTYSSVYTDAGGLGMVLTISTPVFNRTKYNNQQSAVGVVGIDTPVKVLQYLLPFLKAGPNSYGFVINRNGYVVMHHKLNSQVSYLADAPNVDILDLEHGENMTKLRESMIDGKSGHFVANSYLHAGDQLHVANTTIWYYYTQIVDTPLSLAIAFPGENRSTFMNLGDEELDQAEFDMDEGSILLTPWRYCRGLGQGVTTSNATELLKKLLGVGGDQNICDTELVRHLFFDIRATKNMATIWRDNNNTLTDGRLAVFFGTPGGLTKFHPPGDADKFIDLFDSVASTYYKKAMTYSTWVFMSSIDSGPTITASKSIIDYQQDIDYKLAVFGVHLSADSLHELIQQNCAQLEDTDCYLLDDGGFIISSNLESYRSQIGQFLGNEDPMLMWHLHNKSIYQRIMEYDYHAFCVLQKRSISSGSPRYALFTVTEMLKFVYHLLLDTVIWFLVAGWNFDLSDGREIGFSFRLIQQETCTMVRAIYYFADPLPSPTHFHMTCGNCNRSLTAVRLELTNLLLVAATPPECDTNECSEVEQLFHKSMKKPTTYKNDCQAVPRYRRRPDHCFANHPLVRQEEAACGTTRLTGPHVYTLGLFVMAALVAGI